MIDAFFLKVILAFIVGATWITGATMIAEKFGSKIGGVVSGIPSTAVLALFFIGWTQTPQIAALSTGIMPVIMGLNALFIAIYILLSEHKLRISLSIALVMWFLLTFIFVVLQLNNFFVSLLIFALLYITTFIIVEKMMQVKSEGKKRMEYTLKHISIRAVSSGLIVASAVIMSKVGGPVIGGVFAAFPAIMLGTLIITHVTHGRNFSIAVMKVLMVSGSLNVTIYAVAVKYLYPIFGLITGTLFSFSISLITSYITYRFVNKKMS